MCLEIFGKNLKKAISESDFEPHTLAVELGISVRSVWNYQKGAQTPTLNMIADICTVLAISPNQLFDGCYTDQYSDQTAELIRRLGRTKHDHRITIIVNYFMEYYSSLANSDIGRRIRKVRKERGLSIEALAKAVNVARSSIVNYETNHQVPRFDHFIHLCETLKVSAEFLIFDFMLIEEEDKLKPHYKVLNLTPTQVDLLLSLLPDV